MTTIVEPQKYIADLWSKAEPENGEIFRMMRYVMRIDYDDKVILHNVVTGQLVVLDQDEVKLLDELPLRYADPMAELVKDHFLVKNSFDEHQQVINLRMILRKFSDAQFSKHINKYAILPTTACNARCYYCFEHGIESISMTEQVADRVADFIKANCGDSERVYLTWFGGEPTVGSKRIDQICNKLQCYGIQFESSIISNGYLFDEKMVQRAKTLWNLKYAQISVDGAETKTNQIKAFVDVTDNPYRRVLKNIERLIDIGVKISLRMNFDLNNYQDFQRLLDDLREQGFSSEYLTVYPTPILGEHVNLDGHVQHGDDSWMACQIGELTDMSRKAGFNHFGMPLPHLEYMGCSATDDTYVIIGPDGALLKCLERLEREDAIGDIQNGVIRKELQRSWKRLADYSKCVECVFYPACAKIENCSGKERCYQADTIRQYEYTAKKIYDRFKEEAKYDF